MGKLEVDKARLFQQLGYEPHPGQIAMHHSRAQRRILVCGVRWGKSTAAAMEAVAAMMQPAESSMGWVVGPNYHQAEHIYKRVEQVVRNQLSHRLEEVSNRERRIVLRNLGGGLSELRAKSADNPTSLLGEGLDWLIVDEAARLSPEIWPSHLSQRLLDKHGWALLVSTPRGCNWLYRLYRRGQSGRDPDYRSWASPSWENPYLDAAAIEAERGRLPDEAFEQEYGAQFVGEDTEPCEVCGGPSPDAPGMIVVKEHEEVPECPECEGVVDGEGRTLVALYSNGEASMTVLRLMPRRKGPIFDESELAG